MNAERQRSEMLEIIEVSKTIIRSGSQLVPVLACWKGDGVPGALHVCAGIDKADTADLVKRILKEEDPPLFLFIQEAWFATGDPKADEAVRLMADGKMPVHDYKNKKEAIVGVYAAKGEPEGCVIVEFLRAGEEVVFSEPRFITEGFSQGLFSNLRGE